ncbi:hypothetical protein GWI33_020660 [Rhynchophorus ferrugineus]|uniref:Alpha-mannosidase n=1 Tax=Rhynchophorus ferrugineus TaxID=354439 RepID=A0A834HW03_RHYFE|nr:hypothetical protein GWI33_020660 [Rhynchophorus ferrugineus]
MSCLEQILLLLMVTQINCVPIFQERCGYKSCTPIKSGYVNIHLLPHSHDDVGWVKTVDQFYHGTNYKSYRAAVAYIYDTVLTSVRRKKDRKFIYVETAFFWKWWMEQDEEDRNVLRKLVNDGQIEFIGGGWSMNDEAVTNYQSIIDQMAWGLRRLNETFGECGRPKLGWQIDPFGHSSEMASIFAGLGYDGVVLVRIDYEDKRLRLKNKQLEFVWRGSNNLGRPSDLFTSILPDHYYPPSNFCFDVFCSDEPLVDDTESPEYNIEKRGDEFIKHHIEPLLNSHQTSNVMIPMGRDFSYQDAEMWYRNLDKLIKHINNKQEFYGKKYHAFYSTPSCYTAAVQQESGGVLSSPLKTDDFLPYASDPHQYWTGFYTSRASLKRFERVGNNFLQVCKQLFTLTNLPRENEQKLNKLRDAMGIMQHHDAITGTEKEFVAADYSRILSIGMKNCDSVTEQALAKLVNIESENFQSCLLSNMSQCAITEKSNQFAVTVYNPLSRTVNKVVRLPVNEKLYSVIGPDGKAVNTQILPISEGVKNLPGRKSNTTLELVFVAENIPPLGYKSYYVQKYADGDIVTIPDQIKTHQEANGSNINFYIDSIAGIVNRINYSNIDLKVEQNFWYYKGATSGSRPTGAYLFRPDGEAQTIAKNAKFSVYTGNIVTEVHQKFSDYVSQVVRVYAHQNYIEFDWIIGPLERSTGKEVITRYSTNLETKSTFYTDSNGREAMKRVKNYRPTWKNDVSDAETSNYYPVTSKIVLKDEENNLQFAVLTDRAEGGSSLKNGEVELMLHRNCLRDDALGVEEALQEKEFGKPIVVRGSHYVVVGHVEPATQSEITATTIEHKLAEEKLLDSWVFVSATEAKSFDQYSKDRLLTFSGLKRSLPDNVHIMTLEPWTDSTFLLRLEHTFEKTDDPVLSQPASVDLKELFTTFKINSIRETTLGGNQWLEENRRLSFRSTDQDDGNQETVNSEAKTLLSDLVVLLQPMQIRTFVLYISTNK